MQNLKIGLLLLACASSSFAQSHLENNSARKEFEASGPVIESADTFIRDWDGQRAANDGPNCYSTSFYLKGIISAPRMMDEKEMRFWRNNLCTPLPLSEPAKKGDLIQFYDLGQDDVTDYHITMVTSEGKAFQKIAFPRGYKFSEVTLESLMKEHKIKQGCERVEKGKQGDCGIYTVYFRCKSLDEYLNEHSSEIPDGWRESQKELKKIEFEFGRMALCSKDMPPPKEFKTEMAKKLKDLNTEATEKLSAMDRDVAEKEFFWTSITKQYKNLKSQLDVFYYGRFGGSLTPENDPPVPAAQICGH